MPNALHKYSIVMNYVDAHGLAGTLGGELVEAASPKEAIELAMQGYWDPRMGSACCSPLFAVVAVDDESLDPGFSRGTPEAAMALVEQLVHFMYYDEGDERWNLESEIDGAELVQLCCSLVEEHGFIPKELE